MRNSPDKAASMKYPVNLIYDPEYRGYVADVPELPGCMSQGRTVEKALGNVKEAVLLYRQTAGMGKIAAPGLIISAPCGSRRRAGSPRR